MTGLPQEVELAISCELPFLQKRYAAEGKRQSLIFRETVKAAVTAPESVLQLHESSKNAKFIIENFQAVNTLPGKGEQRLALLPTLTFGDIDVPVGFTNNSSPLNTESFRRKYILLFEETPVKKIWELLTEMWKLPPPKVIVSFTAGNLDNLMENDRENFKKNFAVFCKSTGVWVLSDGHNSGVSKFLGRTFQCDTEISSIVDDDKLSREVTLVGMCDWDKLEDKTLLRGISTEGDKSSCYFSEKKYILEEFESDALLNPFQHVYLLLQKKHKNSPNEIPNKVKKELDLSLKSDPQNEIMPMVTFVLAGNAETLHQVKKSVKSHMPCVVVQKSGRVADCLASIYLRMERVFPRFNKHLPGSSPIEDKKLEEFLEEETYECLYNHKSGYTKMEMKRDMAQIMQRRYYLSVLDPSSEEKANICRVICTIYKPYRREDCMKIALQINSLDFLRAIFSRDLDLEFENGSPYISKKGLVSLHRTNLGKSKLFNVRVGETQSTLRLVGKVIFKLVGEKYSLLYQRKISLNNKHHEQFWHLFLYSVLADNPQFAEYFLTLTKCPLGAALFAHKLFHSMSIYAKRNMEKKLAESLKKSSEHFEELAVNLLENMYDRNPDEAYICLTREVPFNLGPYITPFSLAVDAEALSFIKTACCQTYVRRIWVKNIQCSPRVIHFVLPFLSMIPIANIPLFNISGVRFHETQTPAQCDDKLNNVDEASKDSEGTEPTCIEKLVDFYTAPATKFNISMVFHMLFVATVSYLFLAKLEPVSTLADVRPVEWLCYVWVLGFVADEIDQMAQMKDKGPLHELKMSDLDQTVWPCISRIHLWFSRAILYLKDGSWNAMDLFLILFFIATTVARFTLPHESFQMVRILYTVVIIASYFRILRYFLVVHIVGPRIIAIQMMLVELMKFMMILGVFIISFGVAFQGLLNPLQVPSVGDILWRPYWPLFGAFDLKEDPEEMGRDVGNSSCVRAKRFGQENLNCYSSYPNILLAVYLFISNILLLNLLIAIFGNTLNRVEGDSGKHWAFHQAKIVQEYYYKRWLPPPLNILWMILVLCYATGKCLHKRIKHKVGSMNSLGSNIGNMNCDDKYQNDHFRLHSLQKDWLSRHMDRGQKEAIQSLCKQNKMQL